MFEHMTKSLHNSKKPFLLLSHVYAVMVKGLGLLFHLPTARSPELGSSLTSVAHVPFSVSDVPHRLQFK